MRLTFGKATAFGLFLCLTGCHKSAPVSVTPPVIAPPSWIVALEDGDRAYNGGELARADERFDEFLKDAPPTAEQRDRVMFQKGAIAFAEQSPEKATVLFKQLVEVYPASPWAMTARFTIGLQEQVTSLTGNRDELNQLIQQKTAELERTRQQVRDNIPLQEANQLLAGGCAKVPEFETSLRQWPPSKDHDVISFVLGICYSSPEYSGRNWDKAATYFNQIDAASPLKPPSRIIQSQRAEVVQLSNNLKDMDQKIKDLNADLTRLKQIDSQRSRRP